MTGGSVGLWTPQQKRLVLPPEGWGSFGRLPWPTIERLGNHQFSVQIGLKSLIPYYPNARTWWVSNGATGDGSGKDKSNGMTIANMASRVGPGETVNFLPSEYWSTTWPTWTYPVNFRTPFGGVKITSWLNANSTAFTLHSGTAGTAGAIYKTAVTQIDYAFSTVTLTGWGDYTRYTHMGTDPALITAAGQQAKDATWFYFRPFGDPDMTVTANRQQIRLRNSATIGFLADGPGAVLTARGFAIEGGTISGYRGTNGATFITDECSRRYSVSDGTAHDGAFIVNRRFVTSSNDRDGLNGHDTKYYGAEVIELYSYSHHNGLWDLVNDNNNCSTYHEDMRILRVGSNYSQSTGPVVADVNNTRSCDIGVYAAQSKAQNNTNCTNWMTDTTSVKYMDECYSDGLANVPGLPATGIGYTVKPKDSSSIYMHACQDIYGVDQTGTGTLDSFTPAA